MDDPRRTGEADVFAPEARVELIEVADTTLAYDRDVKLPLYARHGIAEIWLIDVEGRQLSAYRESGAEGHGDTRIVERLERIAPSRLPVSFRPVLNGTRAEHRRRRVAIILREPGPDELAEASRLCLRSKAHWGYDDGFLEACREELTLERSELESDEVAVAIDGERIIGVAQVSLDAGECHLEKLFVDPPAMGRGAGRMLFEWAVDAARRRGAVELVVEADREARAFYRTMGCTDAGHAASGSIPGRELPRLLFDLGRGG